MYRGDFILGSIMRVLCHWIIRIFNLGGMWVVTYMVIWNNDRKKLLMAKVQNEDSKSSRNG